MLIDYHVHLQPDSHKGRCKYDMDNLDEYLRCASAAGIDEIGITEHSNRFFEFLPTFAPVLDKAESIPAISRWIREGCTETLDEYVRFLQEAKRTGRPVKVSVEVDYIPGQESLIADILSDYQFDYVLGSVHFINAWAVDYSAEFGWPDKSVDDVFRQYFDIVVQAVESGLFDCIAHPDLVKKLGFVPSIDLTPYYETVAKAMKKADVAYEVSTAGLFKPVGEVYPSPEFISVMHSYCVPFVFSSDAHSPEQVGRQFEVSLETVRQVGYTEVALFDNRVRYSRPL